MSYTPGFAPDARSQWQGLAPHHQELALDVLDRLALDPPPDVDHVADDVWEEGNVRHYVFVHVVMDHRRKVITAVGVGHATRPVEWP